MRESRMDVGKIYRLREGADIEEQIEHTGERD